MLRRRTLATTIPALALALMLASAACASTASDVTTSSGDAATSGGATASDGSTAQRAPATRDGEVDPAVAAADAAAAEADAAAQASAEQVDESREPATRGDGLFPDVVGAGATQSGDGTWTFDVTLSSPYDSPERYADAWRVVGPDGTVYGERILAHDHANEQPFTRSQSGIVIPAGVQTVLIEGRDQVNGWGGGTFSFTLTR